MLDPGRHELNYFVRTADTCINYLLTVHLEQCPIAELTVRPESIFYIGTAKSPLCCNKLTVSCYYSTDRLRTGHTHTRSFIFNTFNLLLIMA